MRRKYNKRKQHETRPVSQVRKFSNQAEYDLKNPAYCGSAYSLVRLCMTQARSTSKDRIATIGGKIVETLYLNRVISENKRIRTPPLSPPFKVGVFVVFYR